MARAMSSTAKRPRISIDVEPDLRRRLRVAAARREKSIREYVVDAIEERLEQDLADETAESGILTASIDPVLAELWDNPADADYDSH